MQTYASEYLCNQLNVKTNHDSANEDPCRQPTLPDVQKARPQRRPDPFVQAETRKIDLRDVWVQRVGNLPNIEVLTPEDSGLHVGVTSFRLKGKSASWVQQTLLSKYRILTAFTNRLCEFIEAGGYEIREKAGNRELYRFSKPKDETYPALIEIFSRKPTMIEVADGQRVVPVTLDEDRRVSSQSS